MKVLSKEQRGFTLIETVIYIALLGLLMAVVLPTVYQLVQGTQNTNTKTTIQDEANFVLRKINWTLTGISGFSIPQSSELLVTKYGGTQVDIKLSGGKIQMTENGTMLPITTDNVTVASLQFQSIAAVGTGPAGVTATFVLNGVTFTTSKFIRK